jgi:hypothetical protein
LNLPKGVRLDSISLTQEPDCCDPSEDDQILNIEVCDGGDGEYYIIHTERWAIDDLGELLALFKSLKSVRIEETVNV